MKRWNCDKIFLQEDMRCSLSYERQGEYSHADHTCRFRGAAANVWETVRERKIKRSTHAHVSTCSVSSVELRLQVPARGHSCWNSSPMISLSPRSSANSRIVARAHQTKNNKYFSDVSFFWYEHFSLVFNWNTMRILCSLKKNITSTRKSWPIFVVSGQNDTRIMLLYCF